ncbi:hypothetical protein ACT3TH_00540 [Psychrobacter sp. AOP22-C1-C5]|uniref:hypothetical protein n=1 Tax=Psychrobacter sp. AOP22-C1-C5 TaxID=3457716 RepID=UPI004035BAA7
MDSSTLLTQPDMNNADKNTYDTPPRSVSDDSVVGSEEKNASTESGNKTQTMDPNTIILAEALTDKTISWQIHNCKIIKKTVTQDLPLPFLYHYDSLDDNIKATYPLTPALLAQFNTLMSAREAAKLIGIDEALLSTPWHVKIIGSLVVFSEALQLAVRLHWTNTGKDTQQIYTKNEADAILTAFEDWQFFGRVDVLYKNAKQTLVSIDGQDDHSESLLTIDARSDYRQLLATHALAVIVKLEADKAELPWFDKAILERLE